jgi:hypothetical protein
VGTWYRSTKSLQYESRVSGPSWGGFLYNCSYRSVRISHRGTHRVLRLLRRIEYFTLASWQNLSRTVTGTAEALNLIWTDNAANYVPGTKSIASPSATGGGDAEKQEISVPDDFGDFL